MFCIRLMSLDKNEFKDLTDHLSGYARHEDIKERFSIFSVNAFKNCKAFIGTDRYFAGCYGIALHMKKFQAAYNVKQ